ncbi:Gfo/Idh/MocA family oxidoreductase [Vibrio sp. JC009]|uniref:Gfo/Idh/MocA family protein n=1 Tax=Vibrio sp. JC009 TaxID=2912314 RepID=UPI0023B0F75A|nr:Gfo/Idh/MocA family oxidoreductase [Vibrio sp. JC009]WED24823.1 Gfo/Idh/MocA family oxidoreductase [Vibrio sp. JC009]
MIKLAIIGSSWITEKFVDAAIASGEFELAGIYSRSISKAKNFLPSLQSKECAFFDDLTTLAQDTRIDAVYVASPNSHHCEQACLLMEQGKHVICEKPLASNAAQASKMFSVAKRNGVILFEAFKTEFLPNFIELKRNLPAVGRLRNVYLSYCQYSSRYQKYLNGENPNTFNPEFSNGSIMDIGYYCVSAAVSLFGKPESVLASAKLLNSGVDAHGSVILTYENFIVAIQHSKVSDGVIASEIQGEDGAIVAEHFSECDGFSIQKKGEAPNFISLEQEENSMIYEALEFAEQIKKGDMWEAPIQRSLAVAEVITEVRKQTGVVFPADS